MLSLAHFPHIQCWATYMVYQLVYDLRLMHGGNNVAVSPMAGGEHIWGDPAFAAWARERTQ